MAVARRGWVGSGSGWLQTAEALRERGRLAWALGVAMERVLASAPATAVADVGVMEAIVAEAVGQLAGQQQVRRPVKGSGAAAVQAAGARAPEGADEATTVWQRLQGADLAERAIPVVWIASGGAGGERVSLALGVAADGCKQVLGLWRGALAEERCSQMVATDLRSRGLGRRTAFVAVGGGERALDLALGEQWPQRAVVAHCQDRVADAVMAHLPAAMREQAAQAIDAAWEIPDVAQARHALSELAAAWQVEHPGAAARLRVEIEATTVPQALGVYGPLAERLRSAAPARYLLERCLPAGAGRTGRDFVASVALAARRRQDGFRRLGEHEALPRLMSALAARAPATAAN